MSINGSWDEAAPRLSSVNIAGCNQITRFMANRNALPSSEIDEILTTLDGMGRVNPDAPDPNQWNYRIELQGGTNGQPGAAGQSARTSLEGKGWVVLVNEEAGQ